MYMHIFHIVYNPKFEAIFVFSPQGFYFCYAFCNFFVSTKYISIDNVTQNNKTNGVANKDPQLVCFVFEFGAKFLNAGKSSGFLLSDTLTNIVIQIWIVDPYLSCNLVKYESASMCNR